MADRHVKLGVDTHVRVLYSAYRIVQSAFSFFFLLFFFLLLLFTFSFWCMVTERGMHFVHFSRPFFFFASPRFFVIEDVHSANIEANSFHMHTLCAAHKSLQHEALAEKTPQVKYEERRKREIHDR